MQPAAAPIRPRTWAALTVAAAVLVLALAGRAAAPAGAGASARPLTVADARAALGAPVRLPHHPLARPALLRRVTFQRAGEAGGALHVILSFPRAGIEVMVDRTTTGDPRRAYARLVAESDLPGRIVTTRHGPTLILDPRADAAGQSTGVVAFVLDGLSYHVYGARTSAELRRVAESIR